MQQGNGIYCISPCHGMNSTVIHAMNVLDKIEMIFLLAGLKIRMLFSNLVKLDNRYRIDRIDSKYLEGNALGCPSRRDLRIYLPPGYFDSPSARYPVIYLLHGYNAGHGKWTITSRHELAASGASLLQACPRKFRAIQPERLVLFYEQLDALIKQGALPPFILVQPDASLRVPVGGKEQLKGSLYVASPRTGDFPRYILDEIIPHVDTTYRTIPEQRGRVLVGGSMGGYGALHLASMAPGMFCFVGASCPMEFDRGLAGHRKPSPMEVELLGQEQAEHAAKRSMEELVATIDLIVGTRWDEYSVQHLLETRTTAFKQAALYLYCEERDEIGLAASTKKMHETMERLGIPHEFVVGKDPRNALSPHVLGSLSQIDPVLRKCTAGFPRAA